MHTSLMELRAELKKMLSLVRTKPVKKKRAIVFGLNSANSGREILLRLLVVVAKAGDSVLAVHVQQPDEDFDPNTFHIHEDICKSKQVDFQVKICHGDSCISELTHQVRVNYATILAIGSCISGPKDSVVKTCLKGLPPTCTLLAMDSTGKIHIQMQGTSQQGSSRTPFETNPNITDSSSSHQLPHPSTASSSSPSLQSVNLDLKGSVRHFTPQEIASATKNFSPAMLIGDGGDFKVYRAKLDDVRPVSVKVQTKCLSSETLLREVKVMAGIRHENIVEIVGCCNREEIRAIVYDVTRGSLKQHLRKLRWSERVEVAKGVAKALKYLHHCCSPPIVHRDVKSSNILLSDQGQPRLSEFGAAMAEFQVDEKIDVYSYGVVLLELITGKHESLVIWARSLLGCKLADRLIDPCLKEDYNHEEMETMMIVARLCLLHSSSRRPTMETIMKLFEEPEYLKKMMKGREVVLTVMSPKSEMGVWKNEESAMKDTISSFSLDHNFGFSDNLNVT